MAPVTKSPGNLMPKELLIQSKPYREQPCSPQAGGMVGYAF